MEKDNFFYKLDVSGYEALAEAITSYVLFRLNLSSDEYVKYRRCRIVEDGVELGVGCYCESMLQEGEEEISINQILEQRCLSSSISFDDLRDELVKIIGFDCKSYLTKILQLDAITLNEDRHFNNIVFIAKDGSYRCGKIFDNGAALLSDMWMYPLSSDWRRYITRVTAKPFNTDFLKQIPNSSELLVIDYNSIFVKEPIELVTREAKRAVEVLRYSLDLKEGVVWRRP